MTDLTQVEEILNKPCGCVEHQAVHLAEKYRKALEAIVACDYRGNMPPEQRIAREAMNPEGKQPTAPILRSEAP